MLASLLLAAVLSADPRALAASAIDAANEWKLDEAEQTAERAYALALACDDLAGQALAADALGVVARLRGERDRALDETSLALALAEEAGDVVATTRAHNDLGRVYADLDGDLELAHESYSRALELTSSATQLRLRSRILNNLGDLERLRSRRSAAMGYFRSSLEAATRAKDRYGRLAAEHNIGLLYAEQNDPRQALAHFQRALEIEQQNRSVTAARTLLSIAEAHRALGDDAAAAGYLRQAREVASKRGDQLALASILLREADLAMEEKQFARAKRELDRSGGISGRLQDFRALPLIGAYQAKLALERGELDAAMRVANRAAEAAAKLGQLDIVAQARSIAGMAALRKGSRAAARTAFDSAIDAVERQRVGAVGGPMARQRFFGRELFPYEQMIVLLAGDGDAAAVEPYVELKKARVVAEASRRARPAQRKPAAQQGAAVVNYVLAGERAFAVVRARGALRVVPLPVSRAELVTLANEFARRVAQRDNGFVGTARELYDALWAPLGLPPDVRRVRILPDEELWRVPFAALVDPAGKYLVESVALSYAPALSELGEDRVLAPRSILLASNLPAHPTEVGAVAALYRGLEVAVVENAEEGALKRKLPLYDVVHLAAHGVIDDRDPLESHLQLQAGGREDGRLTARELMNGSIAASILVLSSCDSATGDVAAGEGLIGMTWAALIAGCPTVVATQWQVASTRTTEVMTAFHRHMRAGRSPAAALQQAQAEAARVPRFAHPYYWAAFVVVGR
ncbi:MAG TPA: CHAT domain-containing protein [Thermoanaerobaculia bacterium]|jgi:CHAT domain-containing protein/tetratricopeptide (TPR) repeat protein